MKLRTKLVSIIVPAYNVEKYIDNCLQSISEQTYKDIEVFIIYDSSDDLTLHKCQKWAKMDSRFEIIVNESRIGVGPARNKGLSRIKGEYIIHLDSDDWIALDFVEGLVCTIEKTQSDYVAYTGAIFVENNKMKRKHWLPCGTYTTLEDKGIVLTCDTPAVWKRLYRTEWLERNGLLYYPEISHFDDWSYDMATVLAADKITMVEGEKNYYRIRQDSLTTETPISDYAEALEYGIMECKRLDVYQKNIYCLMINVLYNFQIQAKKSNNPRVSDEVFESIWNKFNTTIHPIEQDINNLVFGSFSSWWILMHSGISRDTEYYGFSSLISAMSIGESILCGNISEYRKDQIIKDTSGAFKKRIESINSKTRLYIDFQNERYDVGEYRDNYFTCSEAFCDGKKAEDLTIDSISNSSYEYMAIWEEKCENFITMIKEKHNMISIVLIKERLSEYYGNLYERYLFDNALQVKSINRRIEKMEDFFIGKCHAYGIEIKEIDFNGIDKKFLFTDTNFEYGCEPQYLNNYVYGYMGKELFLDRVSNSN